MSVHEIDPKQVESSVATSYKKRILDYCKLHQIAVPPGFGRNTPSRYAIIRIDQSPNKLIAKTWFKVADVIYYLEHFLAPELGDQLLQSIRILDFQENRQVEWNGSKQIIPKASFADAQSQSC